MTTGVDTRASPKRERRLLQRRLQRLRLLVKYRFVSALQWPFEFVFWALDQREGLLADKFANGGSTHE